MPFVKGQSGNRNGRPKVPEIEELRKALAKAAKENKRTFLEHLVKRAYENDSVAIAVAKKILPDLANVDSNIKGEIDLTGLAGIIKKAREAQ